jgi:predicted DNA-binding transcriptional regulator AlpA
MLLTSIEFSTKLNISENVLRQSRRTGTLLGATAPKFLKLGRSIRYRPEEVENWLAQFEAEAEKEGM